jgi:phospholipid-binding lipoprotein MlaA
VDWNADVVFHLGDQATTVGLTVIKFVDLRAGYIGAGDVVDGAALDIYSFTRDAYLQRQRNKQYDGDPPDEGEAP